LNLAWRLFRSPPNSSANIVILLPPLIFLFFSSGVCCPAWPARRSLPSASNPSLSHALSKYQRLSSSSNTTEKQQQRIIILIYQSKINKRDFYFYSSIF
jgi:hypothetical protein